MKNKVFIIVPMIVLILAWGATAIPFGGAFDKYNPFATYWFVKGTITKDNAVDLGFFDGNDFRVFNGQVVTQFDMRRPQSGVITYGKLTATGWYHNTYKQVRRYNYHLEWKSLHQSLFTGDPTIIVDDDTQTIFSIPAIEYNEYMPRQKVTATITYNKIDSTMDIVTDYSHLEGIEVH